MKQNEKSAISNLNTMAENLKKLMWYWKSFFFKKSADYLLLLIGMVMALYSDKDDYIAR